MAALRLAKALCLVLDVLILAWRWTNVDGNMHELEPEVHLLRVSMTDTMPQVHGTHDD
jgi:hypothetical protein